MNPTKSSKFIEYMKLHIISLEQDIEKINYTNGDIETFEWHYLHGSIETAKHLLSVALDIMAQSERAYS
jgi:hypothetical protein